MSSATEARFRVQAQPPTGRVIKVIDLDSATSQDVERLVDEAADADLVVMIVAAGSDAHGAAVIGEACSARRVMTHTFVLGARSATRQALSSTLAKVRPWSLMVVVADDDCVSDALSAFR
jgi:hypothetical protein